MMAQFVFWLAVGFACALGACVVAGLLCKTGEKLRALRRAGWACVLAAAAAVIRGGGKAVNILPRFSADAGLTVTEATLDIATNETDYTTCVVSWLGAQGQPVHVRDEPSERWIYLGNVGEWWFVQSEQHGETNVSTYAISPGLAASNVTVWAQWHLGSDLPPVEVEGDGVSLLDFLDSSTNVVLTYAVDSAVLGGSAGTVRVEVQEDHGSVWTEVQRDAVSGGATNMVAIPGFWIGRDTRWRVRLEVDE